MAVNIVKKKTPQLESSHPADAALCVLSLDPSASTGIVVMNARGLSIHAEELDLSSIKNGSKMFNAGLIQRMDRMKKVYLRVVALIEEFKPQWGVVEGYATHGKFINYTQFELGAVVRSALYSRKLTMAEVSPTSLKKFAAGSGAAKKDQMRLAVYKKWGFENPSDNVVDAYALAKLGVCLAGWLDPATEYESEVVRQVLKAKE